MTYGYYLIRVAHHGNQHVDQHDDHDGAIDTKHEQTDEHGECVLPVQRIESIFFHQAKRAPIKRLYCLE